MSDSTALTAERYFSLIDSDTERMLEVAGRGLSAPVPSCPGWAVADVVEHVAFVYLHGSEALLARRMNVRTGHFMPSSLLASQLASLDDPRGEPGVVTVEIDAALPEIVAAAAAPFEAEG